jgi:outer membrane autotransporter protein
LPGNQQNVANALNGYFNNGGALPPQYVTLFGLTGQALVNALGQADGQNATGIQQSGFQATGQFLSLMLDPFAAQNAGAGTNARAIGFAAESAQMSPVATAAYAATPVKAKPIVYTDASRWNVWAAGFGGSQRTRGDAGAGTSDTTSRFGGFAAGADYRIAPRTTLGFALAGGGTSWGIADGLGGGKADVFQAGLYATHRWDAAYVAAGLSYSWYGTTTDRTLGLAGTDVLRGRFDAHSFGGRVETGYRYALGNFGVTPQAALQVISIRTPSYGETAASGLSTFALNYAAQTANSTRSELGVMFDRTTLLESGNTVALRARAAWGHEFDASRGVNATFQALPGASFTVNGARPSVDSALLSASADVGFARNWMVGAKFDGEFSSRTSSYAGTGRVKYAW